jgi:hypothetical protein
MWFSGKVDFHQPIFNQQKEYGALFPITAFSDQCLAIRQ